MSLLRLYFVTRMCLKYWPGFCGMPPHLGLSDVFLMIRLGLWAQQREVTSHNILSCSCIRGNALDVSPALLTEGALAASSTVEWSASLPWAILWKQVTQFLTHTQVGWGRWFNFPFDGMLRPPRLSDWLRLTGPGIGLCVWGCTVTAEGSQAQWAREMCGKWYERNQTEASRRVWVLSNNYEKACKP